jgi:hypothetical protein
MLIVNKCRELLNALDAKWPTQAAYVCMPVPDGHGHKEVEDFLKNIRKMGYAAFIRTGPFGDEVVVTDKVGNS